MIFFFLTITPATTNPNVSLINSEIGKECEEYKHPSANEEFVFTCGSCIDSENNEILFCGGYEKKLYFYNVNPKKSIKKNKFSKPFKTIEMGECPSEILVLDNKYALLADCGGSLAVYRIFKEKEEEDNTKNEISLENLGGKNLHVNEIYGICKMRVEEDSKDLLVATCSYDNKYCVSSISGLILEDEFAKDMTRKDLEERILFLSDSQDYFVFEKDDQKSYFFSVIIGNSKFNNILKILFIYK